MHDRQPKLKSETQSSPQLGYKNVLLLRLQLKSICTIRSHVRKTKMILYSVERMRCFATKQQRGKSSHKTQLC